MAIVSSLGAVTAIAGPSPYALASVSTSGPFFDGQSRTYAQIYQTQPAVRTVVDFFARNIAQLGLHTYRRLSDTDRVRLADHPLARVLGAPNPATTRFRMIESTVQDIGIYANAYWLKLRGPRLGLVRLPACEVRVSGSLVPEGYQWQPRLGRELQEFEPSEIVHFRLYDPANSAMGFPPLETLRRVLAEDAAASDYRQSYWKNSARVESVIERPATAPRWQPPDRDQFRKDWQEFAGARSGMTPILEDGMTLKPISTTARDSQYIEARKLFLEEVARAYHVPLPMVGILDHATFSNIREQHKQLYQDCLGPWLVMMEEELELQLVPEFADVDRVYLEFNIAEKLKGSFEEQASSLAALTGRPVMTANEARARLNLPRHTNPNADDLADSAPGQGKAFSGTPTTTQGAAVLEVLGAFARRQTARLAKVDRAERLEAYDAGRWLREMVADLTPILGDRAVACARAIEAGTQRRIAAGLEAWPDGRLEIEAATIEIEGDHV